jgi:IS30 family transposase
VATDRHRNTIGWEFIRNSSRFNVYHLSKAQEKTHGRRSRSRRNRRFTACDFQQVNALLAEQYSPEQVSGALRREEALFISHETIYHHVWKDKREGGWLYTHLRGAQKQHRKRHGSYDSRGKLAGKRPLSERPASVESRRRPGHWEIDTVMGSSEKDCIVTLVERKTGFSLIGKLPNRTKEALTRRVIQLIHAHQDIEKATGILYYFASPYHSRERGTNENTNGLIRQYRPKGKSMSGLRSVCMIYDECCGSKLIPSVLQTIFTAPLPLGVVYSNPLRHEIPQGGSCCSLGFGGRLTSIWNNRCNLQCQFSIHVDNVLPYRCIMKKHLLPGKTGKGQFYFDYQGSIALGQRLIGARRPEHFDFLA